MTLLRTRNNAEFIVTAPETGVPCGTGDYRNSQLPTTPRIGSRLDSLQKKKNKPVLLLRADLAAPSGGKDDRKRSSLGDGALGTKPGQCIFSVFLAA